MPRPAVLVALALAALSCREGGPAPAPRPSASALPQKPRSLCSDGGGRLSDPSLEPWFPRTVGAYCVDPNADQRVFGERAPLSLADAAELLSLDSAAMLRAGLTSVVALSYTEDGAEPGRVLVTLLRFGSPEAAYAFFTARIAEAAELGHPTYAALGAGAAAVLGDASALVVRAQAVLRLDFTNARLPPAALAPAAVPALQALAKAIGERLPGPASLPPAARLLPEAERLPLALRYDAVDLAGFEGVGPGALAAYFDGKQRYRLALAVRLDADAAKDVMSTLRRREGSRVLKRAPYDALRVAELDPQTGAVREWIFGKKGALVGGVALDAPPRAAPKGTPPERDAAILRMKRLLDRLPSSAAW